MGERCALSTPRHKPQIHLATLGCQVIIDENVVPISHLSIVGTFGRSTLEVLEWSWLGMLACCSCRAGYAEIQQTTTQQTANTTTTTATNNNNHAHSYQHYAPHEGHIPHCGPHASDVTRVLVLEFIRSITNLSSRAPVIVFDWVRRDPSASPLRVESARSAES